MKKWFDSLPYPARIKTLAVVSGIGLMALGGVVVANSVKKQNTPDSSYLFQNESRAEFKVKEDFQLKIEQDDDAPLRIIDARAKTILKDDFESLVSEKTDLGEVISTPKVTLQNVSDKVVTGITVIVNDQAAKTKFGIYIRGQSIQPGDIFIVLPDSFAQPSENPAKDPAFWLSAKDKDRVAIRVSPTFKDGTHWFNKNYGE